MTDRQAIRIIPTMVEIQENVVLLNKVPYRSENIIIGDYFVAETKYFFVLGNIRNNRLFKVLDKEYKRLPKAVYVGTFDGDGNLLNVNKENIRDFIIKALSTRPNNKTINLLAKAWGELKSRELNPLPGMRFSVNDDGCLVTGFDEQKMTARFQLFRPTEMPYIVATTAGYDLPLGVNQLMNMPPMQRKDRLMVLMGAIQAHHKEIIVPSGIGTTLGDVFSKLNIMPEEQPDYTNSDSEFKLIAKVWKSQKLLGLGKGAIKVRRDLQAMLPNSSLTRTITIRVSKDTFKRYIEVRDNICKMGPIQSFVVKDHRGEKVSLYETGQTPNDSMDKYFRISRIDLVYNATERGYYVKFYLKYSYHELRTGDKLLSYEQPFLKAVAVIDDRLPEGIDIECTWDNIKGALSDNISIPSDQNYVLTEINPLSLYVVERGTSNAKRLNRYDFNGHDAFEMMVFNELFPELVKEIAQDSDKRLSFLPEVFNVFYRFNVVKDNEIDIIRFIIEAENFLKGNDSLFNDFEGGWVEVGNKKFPLPGTDLIMSLANEYDSGISHSIIVRRYLRMLVVFASHNKVIYEKESPRDFRPDLKTYKIITGAELYNLYKSPKLLAFSSIKRIINHMEKVLTNVVAVGDNDPIVKTGPKYGIASVYPSVHPVQVRQKIVKIVKFSEFKRLFKDSTGKDLLISKLDDAVLMNPDLVNQIFLKDNDGDALALRIPTNQDLMHKIWNKVQKKFSSDIETMKLVNHNTEIWEDLEPKRSTGEITITPEIAIKAMDKGISGKLMIGMITRQARRMQYGLIQLLKLYPEQQIIIRTAIIQIAKAMQDVIDGLKHEKAVKEASQMYVFMRDFINCDWKDEKQRKKVYARFFNSPIITELRPMLPHLKHVIDTTLTSVKWLFGDAMDSDDELLSMYKQFNRIFPRISSAYLRSVAN